MGGKKDERRTVKLIADELHRLQVGCGIGLMALSVRG